jgi:hypothetical protein
MTIHIDEARINRYRSQSLRLLESAMSELRGGRWNRSEELLWGSLSLAVKGAALSRGDDVEDDAAVKAYARRLGGDVRDRRVREAFEQLATLSDALERARETRRRVEGVFRALDDISGAIETLWDMVDSNLATIEHDN